MALVQYSRVDVPTGEAPNLFSEENYEDDGQVPFGTPKQSGAYWPIGDPKCARIFELLLEKAPKEEWVLLGTEFMKIAWTPEMSEEMKLRGLLELSLIHI